MFSSFLWAANGNIADGNRCVFDAQYSNAVDGYDAVKFMNPGENFGLKRDGQTLAVEARQPLTSGDTLYYRMTNLIPQIYKLTIEPQNIDASGVYCELVDTYLNTRRVVNLSALNTFFVEITSNPASNTQNRLMVVFNALGSPLPVKFTGISAVKHNADIAINWTVEDELNIAGYDVERSADGRNFASIASAKPTATLSASATYNKEDVAPLSKENYYRIKATSLNGKVQFSTTVKVATASLKAAMIVYPNPVTGNNVQVKFESVPTGMYRLQIANIFGQVVYKNNLQLTTGDCTKTLSLGSNVVRGNYTLSAIAEDAKIITQQLIVQ